MYSHEDVTVLICCTLEEIIFILFYHKLPDHLQTCNHKKRNLQRKQLQKSHQT